MKRANLVLSCCLLAVLFAPSVVWAGVSAFVEPSVQTEHEVDAIPVIDGGLSWTLPFAKEQFGVSAFFWVMEGWAEVYAGPTWKPLDWLQVGLNIGAEQYTGGLRLRYATALNISYSRFNLSGTVEFCNDAVTGKDRSCIWYDVTPKVMAYTVTRAKKSVVVINVGLRDRRFVGLGPYFEVQFPTGYATFWVMYAPFDPEGLDYSATFVGRINPSRTVLGLSFGF